MKNTIVLLLIIALFSSCQEKKVQNHIEQIDWNGRKTTIENPDDYVTGKTYLPVYSHIYHMHENTAFDLTITVSIRNISISDTVYLLKADYFNTDGDMVRQYTKEPVYLEPMETIEIIIAEKDTAGGSGANFVFEWAAKNGKNPPLFEAVMISTYGQQGLSFSTRGIPIYE